METQAKQSYGQDETKTEAEETQAHRRSGPVDDPPEETVGEIMKKAPGEGIKFWVIVISALVYLAGVVYAEVHGLTMLQNGVKPELRMWATMGMIAAGITAVALPVALKVWTIEAKQRIGAYAFYLLDFGFLIFNSFTDFNINSGRQLVPWAQSYVDYILPASPILVAAGWALLWELDPAVKEHILRLTLRAAMKQKLAHKVADAAKGANVTATVNAAAEREVERALAELFGHPVTSGYILNTNEPNPGGLGGLIGNFFGWVSRLGQLVLSSSMPSQPQDSPSEPTRNPDPPQP